MATALAKKLYDRPDGRDASLHAVMILSKNSKKPRYRNLYTHRLDNENGETWSLMRFTEPADINGTGLLTHDRPSRR